MIELRGDGNPTGVKADRLDARPRRRTCFRCGVRVGRHNRTGACRDCYPWVLADEADRST